MGWPTFAIIRAMRAGIVGVWLAGVTLALGVGCTRGKAHEPTPDLFRVAGSYEVGKNPTFLAAADFNRDHIPDLVTANINGQNVSVLLGRGDGTFSERVRYRVGELPRTLVVADVTQDGAPDLVVANNGGNSISILKNRGNGTFDDAVHRPVGQSPLALTSADFNGDGLVDLAVCLRFDKIAILLGDGTGGFLDGEAFDPGDTPSAVVAADFNGDGFIDLAVANSGMMKGDVAVFLGDGKGMFKPAGEYGERIRPIFLTLGDFNGDGRLDLFVGSRVVSRNYGVSPRSYLLENDGAGRFADVTREKAEALSEVGMVSSAVWVDYDNDRELDLVVVGEWMPVRVFRQENGRFADRTAEAGLTGTEGWWNTVTAADLTGNGRQDLVLGNLGLNSYIHASATEPARLYLFDFEHHGVLEQILTFYKHGVSYPLVGRDELVREFPQLRSRYPSYAAFGASRIEDIFPKAELSQATVREARLLASAVAQNNGKGAFRIQALPTEAQFAPIYAALPGDFDGDGHTDLVVGGNFYGVLPVLGRYDAGYGLLLRGDGVGGFDAVDLEASGLVIQGQVRDLKILRAARGGRLIAVARNNDSLMILRVRQPGPQRADKSVGPREGIPGEREWQ